MENASKALLIAGSILIVILLIAVGMRVFNSTSGTTDAVQGTMTSTEVAMFNNKFIQYFGENKSPSQIKALLNIVITNNATVKDNSRKVQIDFYDRATGKGGQGHRSDIGYISEILNGIDDNSKYKVNVGAYTSVDAYSADGYVQVIYIRNMKEP